MSSSSDDQIKVAPPAGVDEEVKAAANSPRRDDVEKAPLQVDQDTTKPTTVRIAKDSQMRRTITFVMARVSAGSTVTLQALTNQVGKAIRIASIVRDRVGNVHQINSLLVIEESNQKDGDEQGNPRSISGIQIVLSLTPLDDTDVGYQKPKPRGYAQQYLRRRVGRDYKAGDGGARDAKQQVSRSQTRAAQDDKSTKDSAPNTNKNERQRRRRGKQATSPEQENRKKVNQADKNGQDQNDDTKSQRSRRNRNRRRSKTTERDQADSKADVRLDQDRNSQRRGPPDDKLNQSKSRATSRQSNRRRKSEFDREAPPPHAYDLDHMGRPVKRDDQAYSRGNGRVSPSNTGRPYYGRGTPYQHGSSYRYIMDYRQDGRDNYFNQYEQNYARNQNGPQSNYYGNGRPQQRYNMGGQRDNGQARPGYFPASSRPKNPDQLMNNYDRPHRGGMQIGRRGGFSAANNF